MKWPFLTYSFTLYVHQQGCRHSASWHVICGKATEYRRHTGPELVRPGGMRGSNLARSRQGSVHEARQGAPRKSHRPPRNRRSPRPGLPIRSVLECEQVRMLMWEGYRRQVRRSVPKSWATAARPLPRPRHDLLRGGRLAMHGRRFWWIRVCQEQRGFEGPGRLDATGVQ